MDPDNSLQTQRKFALISPVSIKCALKPADSVLVNRDLPGPAL
jgi:hypothetical protein